MATVRKSPGRPTTLDSGSRPASFTATLCVPRMPIGFHDPLASTVRSSRSAYTSVTAFGGAESLSRIVTRKPSAWRAPVTIGASRSRSSDPFSLRSGASALSRWPPLPFSLVTEAT